MEAVHYDETLWRTRVIAPVQPPQRIAPYRLLVPALTDRPPGSSIVSAAPQLAGNVYVADKADHHELVQTRVQLSLAVRLRERLIASRFIPATKLAVLERTTAKSIKHLQAQLSHMGRASQAFRRSTRFPTTDKYAANIAAEASLADEVGDQGCRLQPYVLRCAWHCQCI